MSPTLPHTGLPHTGPRDPQRGPRPLADGRPPGRTRRLRRAAVHALARTAALAGVLAAGGLCAGCAALSPAQLALPAALQGQPATRLHGLGSGRSGRYHAAGLEVQYRRGADRLALMDALVQRDRAWTRATLRHDDGRTGELDCQGRQLALQVGVLAGAAQPWTLHCVLDGALQGRLRLQADGAAAGARDRRQGQWQGGGVTLAVRSLHDWAGSALPSAAPAGYLLLDGERPVGAIELQGSAPRLWLPPAASAQRDAALHALTALALLWDPALQ